jgi:hypothetical protein
VLGNLRTRAKLQQEEHTEEFSVGGEFGDKLKIKYKVLDQAPMDRFLAARQNQTSKNPQLTALAMTFMAQACLCVTGYDDEGNSLVLKDEHGVIRLEHRLAVLLDIVPPNPNPEAPAGELTAHEVIILLFGRNAMSIVSHGDDLMEWMQDPAKKVDVGKSSGANGGTPSPSAPSPALIQAV